MINNYPSIIIKTAFFSRADPSFSQRYMIISAKTIWTPKPVEGVSLSLPSQSNMKSSSVNNITSHSQNHQASRVYPSQRTHDLKWGRININVDMTSFWHQMPIGCLFRA